MTRTSTDKLNKIASMYTAIDAYRNNPMYKRAGFIDWLKRFTGIGNTNGKNSMESPDSKQSMGRAPAASQRRPTDNKQQATAKQRYLRKGWAENSNIAQRNKLLSEN